MKLIGLTGPAGSGKDTVARFLCETQGFVQIAIADPLRDGLKAMFGLTDDDFKDPERKEEILAWLGRSPRYLMQTLGTTWGRGCINKDLWINMASRRVQHIKRAPRHLHINGIVVSDIRFENEADWIRDQSGQIWHIHRTNMIRTDLASTAKLHISEQGVVWCSQDRIIHNDSSIDALHEHIAQIVTNEEEQS